MKYKVLDKTHGKFLNWNEAFVSQAGNVFLVKNIEDQEKLTLSLILADQSNYSVEEIEDMPENKEPEVKYRGSIKNCIKLYGEQIFDNARIRLCLDENGLITGTNQLPMFRFVETSKRDLIYITTWCKTDDSVRVKPMYNSMCDGLVPEEEIELLW